MPLSAIMKRLAEDEVYVWITETGIKLQDTGRMKDQIRELTAETLYRRLQNKYPVEMAAYTLEDMATSVFEDGDRYNVPLPANTVRPSDPEDIDNEEESEEFDYRDYDDYRDYRDEDRDEPDE